jgi:hypothetical protein
MAVNAGENISAISIVNAQILHVVRRVKFRRNPDLIK